MSRTSPSPSITVPFTLPLIYPHNPPRSSVDWKRKREEKATAEAEESTAFAAVGGARRTGASSPECLQVEEWLAAIIKMTMMISWMYLSRIRQLDVEKTTMRRRNVLAIGLRRNT
ncbi:uncharacterized protein [Triticum aestivum]|uniref:uncharacterized protein n=1 Tax=Triticum aestivum TaxID=4565 RepID=UPI001D01DEFE|nr:uncharacterized protein LOC123114766 [Triticum aestivum]